MSVEIVIKNGQLFKKPLRIEDITLGKYAYGHMDDYFRRVDGLIEGFNVLYNPNKIGRGMEFSWSNNLKDEITLQVNYASTRYDIEMFYEVVKHIMQVWKAKTCMREGEKCSIEDLDVWCESDKQFNMDVLTERNDGLTIFGANIPITLSYDAIKEYVENRDDEGYADYLHRLQSVDAYYAVPILYALNEEEYFGSYAVTATVDTIFPKKPSNPFGFTNRKTGKPIECSLFVVTLVSLKEEGAVGRMSFDDFAKMVQLEECEEFDGNHVFFKGLSEEKIFELANSDHIDPL